MFTVNLSIFELVFFGRMVFNGKNILITIILFLLLCSKCLFAQNTEPAYNYTVGANLFYGFIYMHSPEIGHLITSHPGGVEIFINKHTYGQKPWESLYNYPDIGFSLGYYDYGNPVLGKTISGISYFDFYLNKTRPSQHNFKLRIGAGLGYNTNPYDPQTNNKNNVLSTSFTFAMQTRLTYEFVSRSGWKFSIAPNITHFSNGAVRKPNKGINLVLLEFGVGKRLGQPDIPYQHTHSGLQPQTDTHLRYNIAAYTGLKANKVGGGTYPFFTLNNYIDKRLNTKSAINGGIDLFYSIALKEEIENDDTFTKENAPDFKRIGLTLGHELFISRVSVLVQFGYYIYRPYKAVEPVYQRYGLKFYANNNKLFFALNLKAHGGTAEMAEFGIGTRL